MKRLLNALRPHKTIPSAPWSAAHRWDLSISRILILTFGLFIFGIGESLIIISELGNAPWSVLAQGVATKASISVGSATFLISCIVLLLWIPLKEMPGFGTVANIIVIAIGIDVGIALIPTPDPFVLKLVYVFTGIALIGFGSALYITCALGPGPRDGWMTSLHRRSGISIGIVRTAIEVSVLLGGWALGGRVGLGTALFALLIGYAIAAGFGVVSRITKG